jgi:hypothetical protein
MRYNISSPPTREERGQQEEDNLTSRLQEESIIWFFWYSIIICYLHLVETISDCRRVADPIFCYGLGFTKLFPRFRIQIF